MCCSTPPSPLAPFTLPPAEPAREPAREPRDDARWKCPKHPARRAPSAPGRRGAAAGAAVTERTSPCRKSHARCCSASAASSLPAPSRGGSGIGSAAGGAAGPSASLVVRKSHSPCRPPSRQPPAVPSAEATRGRVHQPAAARVGAKKAMRPAEAWKVKSPNATAACCSAVQTSPGTACGPLGLFAPCSPVAPPHAFGGVVRGERLRGPRPHSPGAMARRPLPGTRRVA
jgi:hypothetical protein